MKIPGGGRVGVLRSIGTDRDMIETARLRLGASKPATELQAGSMLHQLLAGGETGLFEQCVATFSLEAPIFVLDAWKRATGTSGWGEPRWPGPEVEPMFWLPATLKREGPIHSAPLSTDERVLAMRVYLEAMAHAVCNYKRLLDQGICREHARVVLPMATIVSVDWTASLTTLSVLFKSFLTPHTSPEMTAFVTAARQRAAEIWPLAVSVLMGEHSPRYQAPSGFERTPTTGVHVLSPATRSRIERRAALER